MSQLSFATLDYAAKKKRTKRDVFLAEMSEVVPWVRLEAIIAPHYPQAGPNGGRRAYPLGVMLRIYCLQQWYRLSDPGAEEALYDICSMRVLPAWNWAGTPFRTRRRSSISAICSNATI
jgi:transposase, IS5 family